MADPPRVIRPGPQDLLQLAVDNGPVPVQVGVAVVLDREVDVESVVAALRERVPARLRRRLARTPWGCGGPVWLDDPGDDVARHVGTLTCPGPGDEAALLGVLADAVTTRLDLSRPLWRAVLVRGLEDGRSALVVVVHHLLTDGMSGLAVLSALIDGGPAGAGDAGFPRPAPTRWELVADAWAHRLAAVRGVPSALRRARAGLGELGGRAPRRSAPTSLNRPTGPHRRLGLVRAPVAGVVAAGRAAGGTVNDVLLTVVAGALGGLARSRGESLDSVVVSVPVAARVSAGVDSAANATGAMPVRLPVPAPPRARLAAVVAATRAAKRTGTHRGTSSSLFVPVFRALGAVGALRWFVEHQRFVTTFVSNVRGPSTPATFLGARVTGLVPVAVMSGNVTVAFTALSYAGELVVTVVADPDLVPELDEVVRGMQEDLDGLVALAAASPDPLIMDRSRS